MNTLSWLLYAAEVSNGIKTMFSVVACGSAAAIPFIFVAAQWMKDFGDADADGVKAMRARWKGAFICLLIFGTLSSIAPSRNTVMLIATSEVGSTILASDRAQEISGEAGALASDSLRVLRKFINEQLGDEAK